MNSAGLLAAFGGLSLAMAGASLWLLRAVAWQELRQRRIAVVRRGGADLTEAAGSQSLLVRALSGLGALLSGSGLLPAATDRGCLWPPWRRWRRRASKPTS